MVDIDRTFETERDRGVVEKSARPKRRVRGSELEREQAVRVARSGQKDSTERPGFTRWKNT